MLKAAMALGALLVATAPPALARDNAMTLLARLDAQYDKAWNSLDAQKLGNLFATDAIILTPTTPVATGRPAVVAMFQPLFATKPSGHKLEPVTARLLTDTVLVGASHWSATIPDATGKTTRYHGDLAQVFERIGGTWKLKLTSSNVLPDRE
jgi:uncharacterized protein (TIGR02246 family)